MADDRSKPAKKQAQEVFGSLLSREIKSRRPGKCPSVEDIAQLVEGRIKSAPKKDQMLKHFSTCQACRDTFILSSQLVKDRSTESRFFSINRWGLAASLVLVLFLVFVYYQTSGKKDLSEAFEPVPATTVERVVSKKETGAKTSDGESSLKKTAEKKRYYKHKAQIKERSSGQAMEGDAPGKKGIRNTSPIQAVKPEKQLARDLTAQDKKSGRPDKGNTKVRETGIREQKGLSAKTVPAPAVVGGLSAPQQNYWAGLKALNARINNYKGLIPQPELSSVFEQTLAVVMELKQSSHPGRKKRDFDFPASSAVKVIRVGEKSDIRPDLDFFISQSSPGSAENRFFKLAKQGLRYRTNQLVAFMQQAESEERSRSLSNKFSDDPVSAVKILIAEWEALSRELTGVYFEISQEMMQYLKTREKHRK